MVNAISYEYEKQILEIVSSQTRFLKVRAKNATKSNLNMAIEVNVKEDNQLLAELIKQDYISNASLVEHDGNVTV